MLELNITIPNEAQFMAATKDLARGVYFRPAKESLLLQVGERVKEKARANAPAKFGTLRKSIGFKVVGDAVTVGVLGNVAGDSGTSAQEYGYHIEMGRSQSRMPPPGVLRGWMAMAGIPEEDEYPLRRWLRDHRTAPRPFLVPALEQSTKEIAKLSQIAYQNALNQYAKRAGGGILGRVGAFIRGFFG